jgi:leucine dehydrogenase
MKAAAKHAFGSDSLSGKKIAVQGVGKVGGHLIEYLHKEGAKLFITDINEEILKKYSKDFGATIVTGEEIYGLDVDVFAPCAMGAILDSVNINRLKCKVIAGAANNQLANEVIHGAILKEKGILYAPDFLINAGGVINVYSELANLTRAQVMEKTENIYNTSLEIFKFAETNNITPHQAAMSIAQKRIDDRKNELRK